MTSPIKDQPSRVLASARAITRGEIAQGIRAVALEHLDLTDEPPLDARLVEDLELDSIRLMTLAVEVEDLFQVALEPEDEEAIQTVEDLVRTVERLLAAKASQPDIPSAAGAP